MNNLRILLAAVFHFVHPLEKDSSKLHNNQWSVPPILLFAKNADSENEKRLKIKIFICIQYSTLKKGNPFLTSSRHYGNLRKVPPFLTKSRIFLGFVFDIKSCQENEATFLSNIHISRIAKKLERDISRVFSTFCLFLQSKRTSTFSLFLYLVFLGEQLSNKGRNPYLQSSQLTAVKNDR